MTIYEDLLIKRYNEDINKENIVIIKCNKNSNTQRSMVFST